MRFCAQKLHSPVLGLQNYGNTVTLQAFCMVPPRNTPRCRNEKYHFGTLGHFVGTPCQLNEYAHSISNLSECFYGNHYKKVERAMDYALHLYGVSKKYRGMQRNIYFEPCDTFLETQCQIIAYCHSIFNFLECFYGNHSKSVGIDGIVHHI